MLEEGTEIISDATILLYANLTQQDIFKRAFPNDQILSATITFTNGVGTLPTRFGTLYGDAFKTLGDYYPELSIDDFNKQTTSKAVTIEGGTIKVIPTTTTSLTVKYYPTFADMTALVDPTINSYFHEPIIYGILYRAYEDLQDESLSDRYFQKYDNMLKDKIAVQSNYEEGNQRAGQLFSEQSLISDNSYNSPNYF